MQKRISLNQPLLLMFLAILLAQPMMAQFRVAKLFGDNMVLQRNVEIPVWGWGERRERLRINFNGQEYKARPDRKTGKWMVTLPPLEAGGPYQMTITGKEGEIEIKNIMVGEVWLCSGQSNMEWTVRNSNNAKEEIANGTHPNIRHFDVPNRVSNVPLDELAEGGWEVATPETVGDFTAVGYFFAKELQAAINMPIGLINATWGGTIVETWISAGAIKTIEPYAPVVERLQATDLEDLAQKQIEAIKKQLGGNLPEKDMGLVDGKAVWAATNLDRSDWKPMELPTLWENKGLPNLDGTIWFSKTIELTEEQAAQEATISLGPIDDNDMTWLNGEKIGETDGYSDMRMYPVQASTLRPGKNVLVVRVVDTGGGGGLYAKPEDMYLKIGREKIDLTGEWHYKIGEANLKANAMGPNSNPTLLYNGMIHALIPYPFKGAIWYQGESNAGFAYQYRETFPMLINNWRELWGQGDFPFLWVQLANFMEPPTTPGSSEWAELREAQTQTLSLPNTAQAVIIDIGEADDIHPRNKQDVGLRLALGARKIAYGENVAYSSPMFKNMKVEGNKVRATFEHVGDGLEVRDRYGYINGFAVAGEDQQFHWARAGLVGKNEVLLYSDEVKNPVAVRYGWADNPDDLNLYNSAGLPANPFRTDEWKGVTEGKTRGF